MPKPQPIFVSTLNGKLDGFSAISTDTSTNTFCQRQQEAGVPVCKVCYSQATLESKRYPKLQPRLALTQDSLRHPHPMPGHWIPWINARYFRFCSHGDVEDSNMAMNYIQITQCFPETFFVAWSKNVSAWNTAIAKLGKPHNLRLIFSNASLRKKQHAPPKGWDKVFNVVTDPTDPEINCRGKCKDCMACYHPSNSTPAIFEFIK